MKDKKQDICNIIDKYLEGNLDDAESTLLLDWLKKDQKNAQYFRDYSAGWQYQQSELLEMSWDRLKVKRQLRESAGNFRLKTKHSWGSKVLHISRLQFIRYAAVLIIGLITVFFSYDRIQDYLGNSKEKQWIRAETLAGQKTKIVLPDSSVVWLNSESVLSFPSDFESRKNRIIKLAGEAYFDVAKHGNSKFTVKCLDYDVEVKGTQFNVMAYKDFNRTETTLVEGVVIIIKGKQKLTLKPGERAIYSKNFLTKSKAQVRQATLWKDNMFYFDNIPFRELARRLERWYDVNITLKDPAMNDIYYSGYFKNEETVWQVLDVIRITTPIVYERKQFREITIERKID